MNLDSLEDFVSLVSRGRIILSDTEAKGVKQTRAFFEKAMSEQKIYGVNTGVGALLGKEINPEEDEEFQRNLIASHACGVGEPFSKEITKGALLLLINTLTKGFSGISLATLQQLIALYNKRIIPRVPKIGSLGASGDLIPLSHLIFYFLNYHWLKLQRGEAIFLINGTHFSTSALAWVVFEAQKLLKVANLSAAMVVKATRGDTSQFSNGLGFLKLYDGQRVCEKEMNNLLMDGIIFSSSKNLQDAYSLRCAPQVHGAVYDTVESAKKVVEAEIQSVSHNPIILANVKKVCCGGNFHAQPLAFAADFLGIALSTLSLISERRIARLLNQSLSGLPAFLSFRPGINNGLMITQNTAVSLAAKNKVLAYPASIGSLPVSADQEDFVSLSLAAIDKAEEILENTKRVLAVELLCACQALDLQGDIKQTPGCLMGEKWREIRSQVPFLEKDRSVAEDIEKIVEIMMRW